MSRLTPLERAVLDALAWDLREAAPDLAGQVEESLPGVRRNTGRGAFTELIVARDRPVPTSGPTGRFGTVHAMVGDLADAVAFQVELRHGRLIALHADSYDQDTRGIDFATVPFEDVFVVNDAGASVLYDPAQTMPDSPLLALHRSDDPPLPTYDAYVAPDAPPLDPGVVKAVERIRRIHTPLPASPPDASPPRSVSPLIHATLSIAHIVTGGLFIVALLDIWGLLPDVWNRFGIDDPFLWLFASFIVTSLLRKWIETPGA